MIGVKVNLVNLIGKHIKFEGWFNSRYEAIYSYDNAPFCSAKS